MTTGECSNADLYKKTVEEEAERRGNVRIYQRRRSGIKKERRGKETHTSSHHAKKRSNISTQTQKKKKKKREKRTLTHHIEDVTIYQRSEDKNKWKEA